MFLAKIGHVLQYMVNFAELCISRENERANVYTFTSALFGTFEGTLFGLVPCIGMSSIAQYFF